MKRKKVLPLFLAACFIYQVASPAGAYYDLTSIKDSEARNIIEDNEISNFSDKSFSNDKLSRKTELDNTSTNKPTEKGSFRELTSINIAELDKDRLLEKRIEDINKRPFRSVNIDYSKYKADLVWNLSTVGLDNGEKDFSWDEIIGSEGFEVRIVQYVFEDGSLKATGQEWSKKVDGYGKLALADDMRVYSDDGKKFSYQVMTEDKVGNKVTVEEIKLSGDYVNQDSEGAEVQRRQIIVNTEFAQLVNSKVETSWYTTKTEENRPTFKASFTSDVEDHTFELPRSNKTIVLRSDYEGGRIVTDYFTDSSVDFIFGEIDEELDFDSEYTDFLVKNNNDEKYFIKSSFDQVDPGATVEIREGIKLNLNLNGGKVGDSASDLEKIVPYGLDAKTVSVEKKGHNFLGWSLTQGGAVDQNALKNITASKTVYAVYSQNNSRKAINLVQSLDGDKQVIKGSIEDFAEDFDKEKAKVILVDSQNNPVLKTDGSEISASISDNGSISFDISELTNNQVVKVAVVEDSKAKSISDSSVTVDKEGPSITNSKAVIKDDFTYVSADTDLGANKKVVVKVGAKEYEVSTKANGKIGELLEGISGEIKIVAKDEFGNKTEVSVVRDKKVKKSSISATEPRVKKSAIRLNTSDAKDIQVSIRRGGEIIFNKKVVPTTGRAVLNISPIKFEKNDEVVIIGDYEKPTQSEPIVFIVR